MSFRQVFCEIFIFFGRCLYLLYHIVLLLIRPDRPFVTALPGFRHSAPFSVMPPLRQAQGASSPRTLRALPRRRRSFGKIVLQSHQFLVLFNCGQHPLFCPVRNFISLQKPFFGKHFKNLFVLRCKAKARK